VTRDGLALEEVWAVKTRFSRRRFQLANTFPGSVAVGEVALDGVAPITFVSVYNVGDTYHETTLMRVIADLVPLFDSAKGSRVVLAGDLNMSVATADPRYRRRASAVLTALESLGLVEVTEVARSQPDPRTECPCALVKPCRHIPTWNGIDLDHVYVSESLRDQVATFSVRNEVVERGLSDHSALVVDLELSRIPAARQWDVETFVHEIEASHGSAARRTVEELVSWAENRQLRLIEEGIHNVTLDRFPCSSGVIPEMWFQIDYPAPARYPMYTISIRGSGEVVVQFTYMKFPPFDTPEARVPLREQLNRIPSVEIGSDRLNGRPTFPLSVLEAPGALDQMKAILDRILDETRASALPVAPGEPGGDPGRTSAPLEDDVSR
jgi:hypothetical protein